MPEARAGIRLTTKYDGKGFKRAQSDAQKASKSIGSSFKSLGLGLGVGFGVAALGQSFLQFRRESIELAKEQQRVEAQLEARLASTGNQVGLSARQLKELASELQQTTNIGDEATIAAEAMLLSFTRIGGETFPRATKAVLDLSTALNNGATPSASQLSSTAASLGRALNDPIKGLSMLERQGISFNQRQRDLIKSLAEANKNAEAQAIILEEVERQYGGSAAAAREADKGVQALSNAWGDFKEQVGENLETTSEFNELLTDAVEILTEYAEGINDVNDVGRELGRQTEGTQKVIEDYFGQYVRGIPIIGSLVNISTVLMATDEELAAAQAAVAEQTAETTQAFEEQVEAVAELSKEEQKRLDRVEDIRRDALRDLMDIQAQFEADSLEAQADYEEDREAEIRRSENRIQSLKDRAAKEQLKAEQKLARDLLKVETDLNKSLRRLQEDTDKKIKRKEEDEARRQRKEAQTRQTDGLQDERLFQFEMRQLAAEGEGNAIAAALERREIEKEIAEEKRQEEQQAEDEDSRIEIQRMREDADIQAARLREDAEDRKQILREEAELERQLREEELATATAQENKALKERLAELEKFNKERLADLEETKNDSIAKTAEELTEIEDITKTELRELASIASDLGLDVGIAFAAGLNKGFSDEQQIDSMLDGLGVSGFVQGGGGRGGTHRGSGNQPTMMMFQHGGQFRVGGSGGPDSQLINFLASPGETVTVSPPGQTMAPTFNINATGEGGAQLAEILERKVNEALQEYTDTIIVPVLQ